MESARTQHYFFLILLFVVLAVNAALFLPYVGTLVFAATLATLFSGAHRRILAAMPAYQSTAAAVTMFGIFLVTFVPLSFFSALVFQQSQDLYAQVTADGGGSASLQETIERAVERVPVLSGAKAAIPDLRAYAREGLEYVVRNVGALFSGVATLALNVLLMLFGLFFFLRDGAKFRKALVGLSPLRDADDELIVNQLDAAVHAVIKGALFISLMQGVIAGIGYAIFGVPNAALWGAATVITSLIPGIGTAAVVVPAAIYLWNMGSAGAAIGLAVWGFLIVGLVDNILKPKLIAQGVGIHPFFILLSVLGGLQLFGVYGFLLGPLVLSFLVALVRLYKQGVAPHAE